ncbi:Oxygen-independent coproporphyrinogen-III oxidase 2 [Clostridium perfringens]|nr:Oxygen-independent coproporphyrinogen-III oxidase 2 [Clostridium perfringens]MDH5059608.1 Oxygen-independent coproporphyrinogen-III oxidase 2 [Clostridium perfringens NCTC 8239]MDG6878742.1 Oxygen-independent coproporphyrinogen-III oxidase 2 [Clostridium perfringens]MDG6882891.1 Oxygen-independent coproporphyrinogen-III oxidase 2 [Clostridium perfringens]MDG6886471.1 Oxygen-independent coproporphyrinogen-III oxidase 2 [Clostridium perfringens]
MRYLKAFTKDLDFQGDIKEFSINDRVENILEGIIEEKPDVVAFSCYIWNMEFVNRLAELIKLVDPNIEILYGGPEVSYEGKEFLENHEGEYVIVGEGEKTFREFVLYKLGEGKIEDIKGLNYKRDEKVFENPKRPEMDMNELVFPYTYEEDINNKIVYYEASRGCPFKCKYCLSSVMHGVRFLDVERVKKELKYFMERGLKLVKFVDRTFNCNREYTVELLKYLSEQDTETRFHFEVAADLLTEEQIEILNNAPKGRFQLEVGVQTTNNEVLHNINRYITYENIKEKVLKVAAGKNVMQHLDLIAGLPGEDLESFKKSFNDVHDIRPDEIQLGFLKLLKGSSMREEAKKWGIVYSPYAPYEIIRSKDISYEELLLLKKVEAMVDKYYNSCKFNNVVKFFLNIYEKPFDFYYDLAIFFEEKGNFKRSIGNVEYYKILLDFYLEKIGGKDEGLFKEVLKFDYLCFNKKRWLPDFLVRTITKEDEQNIKDSFDRQMPFKKAHIEKFEIDIINYIKNGEINFEPKYLIFDEMNFDYDSYVEVEKK